MTTLTTDADVVAAVIEGECQHDREDGHGQHTEDEVAGKVLDGRLRRSDRLTWTKITRDIKSRAHRDIFPTAAAGALTLS